MPEHYRVTITAVLHAAPGKEPFDQADLLDETVDTLEEARDLLDTHIPVSLSSGEPMHYEHRDPDGGVTDEHNVGRIYHFWRSQPGRPDLWVDAWASVERVTTEHVPYAEVVPEADPGPELE
jgi:hypothetical protein